MYSLDKFAESEGLKEEDLYVADGEFMGGPTKFINHSYDPNRGQYTVSYNKHDPRVYDTAFFARRLVPKGEELTFDYLDQEEGEGMDEPGEGGAPFSLRGELGVITLDFEDRSDGIELPSSPASKCYYPRLPQMPPAWREQLTVGVKPPSRYWKGTYSFEDRSDGIRLLSRFLFHYLYGAPQRGSLALSLFSTSSTLRETIFRRRDALLDLCWLTRSQSVA